MKTFLIAPARGHAPDKWRALVEKLENAGFKVHWPARDTDQSCPTGLAICRQNLAAIENADCVHVAWDGASQGCLFDLGMAFALEKPVRVVEMPAPTEGKSFQNMVRAWSAA